MVDNKVIKITVERRCVSRIFAVHVSFYFSFHLLSNVYFIVDSVRCLHVERSFTSLVIYFYTNGIDVTRVELATFGLSSEVDCVILSVNKEEKKPRNQSTNLMNESFILFSRRNYTAENH